MQVIVNGEPLHVEPGISVLALLNQLALGPSRVAIELDRHIVKASEWLKTGLSDGARIEIAQFAGGG